MADEVISFERLLGVVLAVGDLDDAIPTYERLGFELVDRAAALGGSRCRFSLADGGFLELASCTDAAQPDGAALAAFTERGGRGIFEIVVELAGDGPADHAQARELAGDDPRWLLDAGEGGSLAGARFVLVPRADRPKADGSHWLRLFTHAVAVPRIDPAIAALVRADQVLWDRSGREDWGLDTAVFRQNTGSNVELVSPVDETRQTASVIADFLRTTGGGHYMTVFEVEDADAVHTLVASRGARTLGPPTVAPPESPWGPVRQCWLHPKQTHGAFLEFLSLPDQETPR